MTSSPTQVSRKCALNERNRYTPLYSSTNIVLLWIGPSGAPCEHWDTLQSQFGLCYSSFSLQECSLFVHTANTMNLVKPGTGIIVQEALTGLGNLVDS